METTEAQVLVDLVQRDLQECFHSTLGVKGHIGLYDLGHHKKGR